MVNFVTEQFSFLTQFVVSSEVEKSAKDDASRLGQQRSALREHRVDSSAALGMTNWWRGQETGHNAAQLLCVSAPLRFYFRYSTSTKQSP